MNKKALSPLVATILLIAFAIALGIVVMSWGKSYIEEKAEFTAGPMDASACGLVELGIIEVGGKDRICYSAADSSIEVFLENGPELGIADIRVRVLGSNGIHTIESVLDSPLERSASAQLKFNYPSGIGAIEQVKLTPIVSAGGEYATCTSQAAVSEDIGEC